ncbi:hypothetical protein CEXT_296471 [Caerostris extrusa]|uniref:Uncharacterized protein n=1 Tax=Caerostris extrusa TaxID=172846 RepID=A0AAV4P253_CAEEX|nr:hypothetical protein CEXT_296471 [Caerostris extrusa]
MAIEKNLLETHEEGEGVVGFRTDGSLFRVFIQERGRRKQLMSDGAITSELMISGGGHLLKRCFRGGENEGRSRGHFVLHHPVDGQDLFNGGCNIDVICLKESV